MTGPWVAGQSVVVVDPSGSLMFRGNVSRHGVMGGVYVGETWFRPDGWSMARSMRLVDAAAYDAEQEAKAARAALLRAVEGWTAGEVLAHAEGLDRYRCQWLVTSQEGHGGTFDSEAEARAYYDGLAADAAEELQVARQWAAEAGEPEPAPMWVRLARVVPVEGGP